MRVHSHGLHRFRRDSLRSRLLSLFGRRFTDHRPDATLLISVLIILTFGLTMLASATSILSFEATEGKSGSFFLVQQILHGIVPGIIAFLITLRIPYTSYRRHAWLFLTAALVLPALPFIPGFGIVTNSVRSWVNVAGFSIQTSELAKGAFLIWLAHRLSSQKRPPSNMLSLISPFAVLGIIAGTLFMQPDTGTALIFIILAFVMFYGSSARLSHVLSLGVLSALLAIPFIISAPYKLKRLLSFINPDADTLGVGYQVRQALIALGTGSWFGVGIGRSQQKFMFLPEVESDSIFAIIGEEWGFIASSLLVAGFAFISMRGLSIAKRAPDEFGRLLALGITSLITIQALFNLGAMLGLIPLTGLPLPFISLGGTNLVLLLALIGVLGNISSKA